jgi:tRNA (adenine57-N1/adenine58-N1)-methyltransferase
VIQAGDWVLLWFEDEVSYLVEVKENKKFAIHKGRPMELSTWIGKEYGATIECDHAKAYLLKPTSEDLMMKASRESGIIYPKDAGWILLRLSLSAGKKVLELGTGSGALTGILARAVAPTGRVYSYDLRPDFQELAKKNLEKTGCAEVVTFQVRTPKQPILEKEFDAAVLDVPEPWEELDQIKESLAGGGNLVSLNPTYNQIERMSEALKQAGFIRIEACEILLRPILARMGKTRPVQRMVSHTEFIVSATKVSPVTAF